MTLDEYRQSVLRTLRVDASDDVTKLTVALGLAGEAGEAGEVIKKAIGHRHGLDRPKFIKELGDVAWYWMASCILWDIDPEIVLIANKEKLLARYKEGFTTKESMERVDEQA